MGCCSSGGCSSNANPTMPASAAPADAKIALTDKAVEKVKYFAGSMEGTNGKSLRIAVRAGGCSGFSYDFVFDIKRDGDFVNACGDIEVLVDANSMSLLKGATVDFVESFQGAGFVVNNPNATGGCGCGSSFSA